MMPTLALVGFFLAQGVALLLIPLGLPGLWLQVLAAAVVALTLGPEVLGWGWVVGFAALALAGEVIEFLAGQWGARRFGGSRAAAWGALLGGIAGAIVGGIPVPVVGSILASFVGTFAGALGGEMYARRRARPDLRVGLGAILGRAVAVAVKLSIAFAILVLSAAAVIT